MNYRGTIGFDTLPHNGTPKESSEITLGKESVQGEVQGGNSQAASPVPALKSNVLERRLRQITHVSSCLPPTPYSLFHDFLVWGSMDTSQVSLLACTTLGVPCPDVPRNVFHSIEFLLQYSPLIREKADPWWCGCSWRWGVGCHTLHIHTHTHIHTIPVQSTQHHSSIAESSSSITCIYSTKWYLSR